MDSSRELSFRQKQLIQAFLQQARKFDTKFWQEEQEFEQRWGQVGNRPTSYEQFTLPSVRELFSLTLDEHTDWTSGTQPVEPSARLQQDLADNVLLALATNTEKARSELIITPILSEVRRRTKVTVFSGKTFNVSEELGLKGRCDFIISASREIYYIEAPVLTIVEAKNESIVSGLGQCLATMVAAQMFNKGGVVYGAVTTGDRWKFIKLVERVAYIAPAEYTLDRLGVILGVLEGVAIAENNTGSKK